MNGFDSMQADSKFDKAPMVTTPDVVPKPKPKPAPKPVEDSNVYYNEITKATGENIILQCSI